MQHVANLFLGDCQNSECNDEPGLYDYWASAAFVRVGRWFAYHYTGAGYSPGFANRCCGGWETGTPRRRRNLFRCLLWGAAASFGLGALLAVSGFAYNVLRIVGAIYLSYLGIKLFIRAFARTSLNNTAEPVLQKDKGGDGSLWLRRGLLTNLLNPKVGVFYLSFLPQFIPAGVQVWSFSILLALLHATEGLLWFLLLTNATELLSSWLRQRSVIKALDSAMAAMFVAFGLKLAFDKAR